MSLFSGLNNLENISLNPQFATICGYTDRDLDTVFTSELQGLDRDSIRTWYKGYRWAGTERLYNPIDVLLLFRSRKFASHWYETGTPDLLLRLMVEQNLDPLQLENSLIAARRLSRFDVDDIDLRALMFQTGYLTIAGEERRGPDTFYALEYPNLEVRQSFNQDMLAHLGHEEERLSRQGQRPDGTVWSRMISMVSPCGFKRFLLAFPTSGTQQATLGNTSRTTGRCCT